MRIVEIPKNFTEIKRENADSLFKFAIESFTGSQVFNPKCYSHLLLFYHRVILRKEKWYANAELYLNAHSHLQLRKQVEEKLLSNIKPSEMWKGLVDYFLDQHRQAEMLNAIDLLVLLQNITKYMDQNEIKYDKNIEIQFDVYTS